VPRIAGTDRRDFDRRPVMRKGGPGKHICYSFEMSFRVFLKLLAATAMFVPLMLLSDSADLSQQIALATATGLFLILMVRKSSVTGGQVVCAMAIATAGELFLSLGWGLYSYRYAAIPFYVPIGHGIFYALAAESARQELLRKRQNFIVPTVVVAGSLYALITVSAGDTWGLLWWIGAAWIITRSRSPLLMSTCVVYTVLLEWAGTAIGTWRWAEIVPVVGLRSANPPSGVGILYCLLDLFTMMACSSVLAHRIRTANRDLRLAPDTERPGALHLIAEV
jgi:hypothetical protein